MTDPRTTTPNTPDHPGDQPLLELRDLEISFTSSTGVVNAVRGANLTVYPGQSVAIVGESGSGKSTTAMSIIGLLPGTGKVTGGKIIFNGEDITGLSNKQMEKYRGSEIGLVPQDPMTNLNPVWKIGSQVKESLKANNVVPGSEMDARVTEVLEEAGLPDAERRAKQYPHEFSGGMRQRALIAIGLAARPKLLIADEPTSALDVTVQRQILDHLEGLTRDLGTAVLFITHDLGLAAERAEHLVVMHRGLVVETGPAEQLLNDPQHPYTQSLVRAAPSVAAVRLAPDAFAAPSGTSGSHAAAETRADGDRPSSGTAVEGEPKRSAEPLVTITDLTKVYPKRGQPDFYATRDVTLEIPRGSTVSIVGESGSGKTTTARMLLKLIEPTSGSITFEGKDVLNLNKADLKDFRQRVQAVFQDPYSSLNPMFTVGRIIEEPLVAYKRGNARERRERVLKLMDQVALPAHMFRRYPAELSGGQRQRIAIARALALNPDLIVCDEPVSALDVLVQAQILDLLKDLQRELGLSYLFISHDLAVVRLISDYVCVMKDGELVEAATSEEIFTNPRHPYTRKLLASIPGNELEIDADAEVA